VRLVERYAGGRLVQALFWAAALFALVMALIPHPPGASLLPDKAQHAIAFGVLGLLGTFAYPRLRSILLVGGLSLFGAAIEFAQAMPVIGRDADPLDWLTDTVACVVIVLVLRWWAVSRR
jgi:hypothetical protein